MKKVIIPPCVNRIKKAKPSDITIAWWNKHIATSHIHLLYNYIDDLKFPDGSVNDATTAKEFMLNDIRSAICINSEFISSRLINRIIRQTFNNFSLAPVDNETLETFNKSLMAVAYVHPDKFEYNIDFLLDNKSILPDALYKLNNHNYNNEQINSLVKAALSMGIPHMHLPIDYSRLPDKIKKEPGVYNLLLDYAYFIADSMDPTTLTIDDAKTIFKHYPLYQKNAFKYEKTGLTVLETCVDILKEEIPELYAASILSCDIALLNRIINNHVPNSDISNVQLPTLT